MYSGLTYNEVLQLPTDLFLLMVKNQYLEEMNKTKEGQEYLDKCKRLSTTEPDRAGVEKLMNRGGNDG